MRFIFENILRLNVWPNISILESVPWALQKNVYVVAIESSVLPGSVRPRWVVVFLPVSLRILCLLVVSIAGRGGVLTSPTIIVELSVSPFHSISSGFMYFAGL